ncbi:hypothetical protein Q8A67_000725 [Cirrhinus molitorella]|uniref:Uncharacterized protein n=1 Tax=Cirrhinus molitorella TaxID=172907 RepID=A0AA88Q8L7_9TELE|nr:hypothetical protein Q8A67_000725 [Cirrhinus molitorella]
MSGKFWILIIAFITHVYDVQSKCMQQDLKTHLDDLVFHDHIFEIKMFSPETKEHELLSVTSTLCSYWINNKKKKLKVVQTFEIMLYNLNEKFIDPNFCDSFNCTDAYVVHRVNTATFGEMYRKSCNGSVSDLKCPSKNTSLTTIAPTAEYSTTFLTTGNLLTTDHKKESTTASTTMVSLNITDPENLTTVSSPHTETKTTIKTCYGLLVLSFVLNIVLLFTLLFYMRKNSKKKPSNVDQNLRDII